MSTRSAPLPLLRDAHSARYPLRSGLVILAPVCGWAQIPHAADEAAGATLMIYIAAIAVIGILLLQLTGAIPPGSVGGSLTIGLALIAAALAVGIHEAWTMKRGALGWIVNIVVSFLGVLLIAPLGGGVVAMALSPFATGTSLASTGGGVMAVALAAMTAVVLASAWGALWIVNRWR